MTKTHEIMVSNRPMMIKVKNKMLLCICFRISLNAKTAKFVDLQKCERFAVSAGECPKRWTYVNMAILFRQIMYQLVLMDIALECILILLLHTTSLHDGSAPTRYDIKMLMKRIMHFWHLLDDFR